MAPQSVGPCKSGALDWPDHEPVLASCFVGRIIILEVDPEPCLVQSLAPVGASGLEFLQKFCSKAGLEVLPQEVMDLFSDPASDFCPLLIIVSRIVDHIITVDE